MVYPESEWLNLSGILQFCICCRRWALINLENVWEDNYHTIKGLLLHERVHNDAASESRGNIIIDRGLHVHSEAFGLTGICDAVEFHQSEDGILLHGRHGLWKPYPIEYKKGNGSYSEDECMQLYGQAVCLEEMLCCDILSGAIFYFETRRRETVVFTDSIKSRFHDIVKEMHYFVSKKYIPKPVKSKICASCSLLDMCHPDSGKSLSADEYIRQYLGERCL